uniref:zinc-ribbon and DUF3426 domain-containing protein n=1 Tax=Castellaniella defragrans TaxID=75697 RepID=UPI00333F0FCE
MDLITRCPNCGTAFEASLQELQLRKGYIRCVQCAHIFDGYAEVVSEPGAGHESDPHGVPTPPERPVVAPPASITAAPPGPQVFRSRGARREEPHFTVGNAVGGRRDDPSIGSGIEGGDPPPAERILIAAEPSARARPEPFVVEPHPVHAGRAGSAAPLMRRRGEDGLLARLGRALMKLLLALLVLLALAQLAYIYRSQIALAFPALRPVIERACVPLRCQVPYARDLASLSISGSALRTIAQSPSGPADVAQDAARHYMLNVTLRNLSDRPQEWPTIVLDLNDASGTRLVRRNLEPRDYLTPDRLAGPFAARGEVLVRVPLAVTGVQVNGYQLDLFFP